MNKDNVLPNLPGSDPVSLQDERLDEFYQIRAKDFWAHAKITSNKVRPFKKCNHYFVKDQKDIRCRNCSTGWDVNDYMQVQDGQLVINGEVQLAH